MGLISWIVLGGVAGWLASLVAGLGMRMGCLTNILAGVLGAVLGGALFNNLASKGITGFDWWSLFVAFVGALIILLLVRLLASILKDRSP